MKVMSLNIWGGHVREPLLEFIKQYQDVDVFCFQEVYHQAQNKISTDDNKVSLNIFGELQALLPEHKALFRPVVRNIYGIGMLVKKSVEILEEGEEQIHDNPDYAGMGPTHSRNLQWLHCRWNQQEYTIINVHGLWNGKGKTDSPERLVQAQRIRAFMETLNTPVIVCGDFNLRPDTESLQIIEAGMNNLIRSHNVTSTRTGFYKKEEKFADYVIVSPDLTVNSFNVLKDEVSDHAPLLLALEA